MRPATSFWAKAMAGSATVTLLLGLAMAWTTRRLEAVATTQVHQVRTEEVGITLVERLRWTGELIVSDGRGYLIVEDPALLTKLERAGRDFDEGIAALQATSDNPRDDVPMAEVQRAAAAFRRLQDEILVSRRRPGAEGQLTRFEDELLPLHSDLSLALDRLVEQKEADLQSVYAAADRARHRLETSLYALVALLVVVGLGINGAFATQLARAYAKEQQALDTARMAIAARDEILGVVAHDLRNPLGAISLKAALLERTSESEATRRQASAIELVTRRMESLVKTMLDVATIEAGRFSLSPAPCDVEDLLRQSIDELESLASSRQIALASEVKAPGLVVRADRERTLQVLSNLLGNALKFTPDGGAVSVCVDAQGHMARFVVVDSGPGIPEAHLPHLFDRFWKHETNGRRGTGLGLFIVKSIVEAHDGEVSVANRPGGGATFAFTLPLVRPSGDVA